MRMLVDEKPYSPPTELISGDGEFNEAGFKNFLNSVKYREHDSVAVAAIIGKQCSGKSTLMNQLFGTNFKEMEARQVQRRGPTTKGVWTAKALETERLIIVVDLEGTDSQERGQDDKTFERQSGTFAAIIADVLIVNMNCLEIGLEEGGNRPLFKVIFEAMIHLFTLRKTTLLFVLRNKAEVETPFERLEIQLMEDVEEIWKTATKPPGHENTPFSQIFSVEVVALSSYTSARVTFVEEVDQLRSRLLDITIRPRIVVPGSEVISFAGAKKAWDTIKRCNELNGTPCKELFAIARCEAIAKEKLSLFESDTDWLALREAAASRFVTGFIASTRSILDKYLSQYDSECEPYKNDESIEKRKHLMSEASKVVHPAHKDTLRHGRSAALQSFETQLTEALSNEGRKFAECVETYQTSCVRQFDERFGTDDATFSSDVSTAREQLLRDIENHWNHVHAITLQRIEGDKREQLSTELGKLDLGALLKSNRGGDHTWRRIRSAMSEESEKAAVALRSAVAKYELEPAAIDSMIDGLKERARELMEKKFKEIKTHHVLALLKHRFFTALIPVATGEEVNQPTKEDACRECVKLLSTMAVIRLDEREGDEDDDVERVLLSALMPAADQILPDPHPLASDAWEQVYPMNTVITPLGCRDIWNQFKPEMDRLYANALLLQGQLVKDKHWGPLTWVILGILILGGTAALIGFIRVTNIDVLAYAATGICMAAEGICVAAKGIGTAATASIGIALAGIGIVVKGMDALEVAIELWKNMSQEPNFTKFCRRNRTILKTLKHALKKLYKRIKSLLEKGEAVAVAA